MQTEAEIREMIERIHQGQQEGNVYYRSCEDIMAVLEWVVGDAEEPI